MPTPRSEKMLSFEVKPTDKAFLQALLDARPSTNRSAVLRTALRIGLQSLATSWPNFEEVPPLDPATFEKRTPKKR